jgi:hypothetical protein
MRLNRWAKSGVLERVFCALQAAGRGGWNTKIHALAAGDREVVGFSLSPGNAVSVRVIRGSKKCYAFILLARNK